jgi:hypothetical protein
VPLFDVHTLTSLLIAFVMIALLGLVLRWTFSTDVRKMPHARDVDDYGLLVPVAVVESAEEAERLQSRLVEAGVRATRSQGADGRYRVLVFASELDRARRVGGWSG